MFKIEEVFHLPAPLARTWRVIEDVDRYQDWHPFVRLQRIPGKPDKVTYTHRRKGRDFLTVEAELDKLEPKSAIAWRIGIRGFLELEEGFAAERDGRGTRVVHHMSCTGLCASLVTRKLRSGLLRMLLVTDAALRQHLNRTSTIARYSQVHR